MPNTSEYEEELLYNFLMFSYPHILVHVMSSQPFKKLVCVSLTLPEARCVCLDFDVQTSRQIQDIYSGMPRGYTVGGDVVAVRVASLSLSLPF